MTRARADPEADAGDPSGEAATGLATDTVQTAGENLPATGPPRTVSPADLRWLAAGGGSLPEFNQVSIEQDLALASRVLGPGGLVLYAGGPGSVVVQVQDAEPRGDPLLASLGALFAPRGGRDAHYRSTTLPVTRAATRGAVLETIDAAVTGPRPGPEALVLFLAGHGERGPDRADNFISLWEQSRLVVRELAEVLDRARRPVRVVATTCFSGGFAELAFTAADPGRGAAPGERCGLFATSWDLEASGCDPNPDRGLQEGYGLHFLHALEGRDRDGDPLPAARLDLDGDGRISMLEAHTRVRLASVGIDVPTTTSERWLRQHAPARGPSLPASLVEEDAVFAQLGAALGLAGRESQAQTRLAELEQAIDAELRVLEDAQRAEDDAYRRAAAGLLARWPVLDDPWHPDFTGTIESDRAAISEHLERDDAYAEHLERRADVDQSHDRIAELRQRAALHERLARAVENRVLAGRLRARGGAEWRTYQRFLACERAFPPSSQ